MQKFISKFMKCYDVILNILFVVLLAFTAFAICYYCLPDKTSAVIAKALSYSESPELASTFMNYLNGFTIGAGFPLWFSQKAMVSRYINNASNLKGYSSTQEILAENLNLSEIQVEFQKAEALRFVNSPTMPAKARMHYKKFLEMLEGRGQVVEELKTKLVEEKPKVKKAKKAIETADKLDGLV